MTVAPAHPLSPILIHVLQDQCIDPRLRRLLDYHQTVALTDRIGAPRVAGGFPVERLNLDVNKRSVGVSDINFIKTVPIDFECHVACQR